MAKVHKLAPDPLRTALAQLAQAEATLVANQAAFVAQMDRMSREVGERFQHIESILLRLVEVLPEVVPERIGLQKK